MSQRAPALASSFQGQTQFDQESRTLALVSARRTRRLGVHDSPGIIDPPKQVGPMALIMNVPAVRGCQLNVGVDYCPREVALEVGLDIRESEVRSPSSASGST